MSKFIVIMTITMSFIFAGCSTTTTYVQSTINTPNGPLQAQGDVTVVERTTEVAGEKTFQSSKNLEAARLELAIEKEKTKRAKAQARAANPCSSWIMAPSHCYGYVPGRGGVVVGREGGTNYRY